MVVANTWIQPSTTGSTYYINADQLGQGLQFAGGDGLPSEADILGLAMYLQNSGAFTNVLLQKSTQTFDTLQVDLTVASPNFDEPTG